MRLNLCHPDKLKSCAACCGLYNVSDATKPTLEAILRDRSEIFEKTERSMNSILEFKQWVQQFQAVAPLDPDIHVCEFIGFLDPGYKTVGCLLHPSVPGNNNNDFRGLCYYGSMACKSFFMSRMVRDSATLSYGCN